MANHQLAQVSWSGSAVDHEIVGMENGEILAWDPTNGEISPLPLLPLTEISDHAFELILALFDEYVSDAIRNEDKRVAAWIMTLAEYRLETYFKWMR